MMRVSRWVVACSLAVAAAPRPALADGEKLERNFAGSIQLDYMAVPTDSIGRKISLDAATVEVSLKVTQDFGDNVSASVKLCVACHGVEAGMAFFDLRVADELNFRVGRFTPQFGSFPIRHDPANHRTSDKPLPYDMGRMLRFSEWNMGILPSPWVDNGVEISGAHYFSDDVRIDYAGYAIGGPRASSDATDFEYKLSRSGEAYYVDNNSRPSLGVNAALNIVQGRTTITAGASAMAGTYDPENKLHYQIAGAHLVLQLSRVFVRAEYLLRRTEMSLGSDPAQRFKYGPGKNGRYDPYFLKQGFYTELELPVGDRLDVIGRFDGLRRQGNVLRTSELRSDSAVLRYTAGASIKVRGAVRIKLSGELYDFSDFSDEVAIHLAVTGAL
ncbi:MAG: hypothetical protein E6J90_24460 [Deltaproteobacteria bacterium]|nr:MAG: hypothetical protein E6J90_24460 [Deltaproteobacteria bacterium]